MRAHKCACLRLTGETDRVIQERRAYLVEEAVDEAQCGEIPDSGAGGDIHPDLSRKLGEVRHGSVANGLWQVERVGRTKARDRGDDTDGPSEELTLTLYRIVT